MSDNCINCVVALRDGGDLLCPVCRNAMTIIAGIQILRDDEGSAVEIVCDNGYLHGQPNCLIRCHGDWTDWEEMRFAADTLLQCITQAVIAKAEKEGSLSISTTD